MSSTTDQRERGQILVLFAGGILAIMLVAALAFDTGMMLVERRDQQNAADAAALAGARYLPGNPATAESAARDLATRNGFTDGVDSATVDVYIPPISGEFVGRSGFIQVAIASTRPSIFAGVMGVGGWNVGASAVATNEAGIGAPFAMLSLDPTGCEALLVSGNGTVNSSGNIQVNSTCTDGALKRVGGGSITIDAPDAGCNVVGDIKSNGSGTLTCTQTEGAPWIPDPLEILPAPALPVGLPAAPMQLAGSTMDIPNGCPGAIAPSVPASAADPATCQFPSAYAGTEWRLYPGYYPGGIKLQAGRFYLEPGIYYVGGGGLGVTGNGAAAISVAAGGTTLGGGILIYNTEAYLFHDQCAAGTATDPAVQCISPIVLNGADADIRFWPLDIGSDWDGLVIFQDRDLNVPGDDVIINGGSSEVVVRGTIYTPSGDVKINGNGGTVTLDQVIAFRFAINGAPASTINVLFDQDFIYGLTAAGLVE